MRRLGRSDFFEPEDDDDDEEDIGRTIEDDDDDAFDAQSASSATGSQATTIESSAVPKRGGGGVVGARVASGSSANLNNNSNRPSGLMSFFRRVSNTASVSSSSSLIDDQTQPPTQRSTGPNGSSSSSVQPPARRRSSTPRRLRAIDSDRGSTSSLSELLSTLQSISQGAGPIEEYANRVSPCTDGIVFLTIHEVTGLPATLIASANLCCSVQLGPMRARSREIKAPNTIWNEQFNLFTVVNDSTALSIFLVDVGFISDSTIGDAYFALEETVKQTPFVPMQLWLDLFKHSSSSTHALGRIRVTLYYLPLRTEADEELSEVNAASRSCSAEQADLEEELLGEPRFQRDRFGFVVDESTGWLFTVMSDKAFWKDCTRTPDTRWDVTIAEQHEHHQTQCNGECIALPEKQLVQIRRHGIPQIHRGEFWRVLSGAARRKSICPRPDYYSELVRDHAKMSSPATEQIEKDLLRTFPGHPLCSDPSGIDTLRRVLTAYSWSNSFIGYCQSMNFIAAFLLLFNSEEDVFWILTVIIDSIIPQYFGPCLVGARADLLVLKQLVEKSLPKLSEHLQTIGLELEFVAIAWFLRLFVGLLPTETVVRIFDCLLVEGPAILFGVSLTLLREREQQLLQIDNYGDAFEVFKNIGEFSHDPAHVMKSSFKELAIVVPSELVAMRSSSLAELETQARDADVNELLQSSKFTKQELEKVMSFYNHAVASDPSTEKRGLSKEQFTHIVSLIYTNPEVDIVEKLFKVFNKNNDKYIDLSEFLCGMCILCKGTPEEKLHVAFKLFDVNDDGFLDASELGLLLSVQQQLYGKSRMRKVQFSTASIMSRFDKDGNNKLDFEEFSKALQEPPYTILAGCLQVMATSNVRISSSPHESRASQLSGLGNSMTHILALSTSFDMRAYDE